MATRLDLVEKRAFDFDSRDPRELFEPDEGTTEYLECFELTLDCRLCESRLPEVLRIVWKLRTEEDRDRPKS